MRVLLFGATGMVGQGVLRECLADARVQAVLAVGRRPVGMTHPKLAELVRPDLFEPPFAWDAVADRLADHEACFFCLGVSAAGMREADYARVTYDLTLAVATVLARRTPGMTFVYVSGMGTDSTERGRSMWARVKGRTENALLALPLRAFMFRPGAIEAVGDVRSTVGWYRAVYAVLRPVMPLLRRLFPGAIVTTAEVGRAMLAVARDGAPVRVLESRDIGAIARAGGGGGGA